jgi:FAD dependent oxidoreductase TIGR03364
VTPDVVIVGSGIVGLAHALAAVRRGLKTLVIDRDARPTGASIRNFGFITITGQRRGETWRRARRSAEIWAEVAPKAGIPIVQKGLLVLARRPEAAAVLEAFMKTEMGEGCELLSASTARAHLSGARPATLSAALRSHHELRVESRTAIPSLVDWLASLGVEFRFGCAAYAVGDFGLETSGGTLRSSAVIACPGDDLATLFPGTYAKMGVTRCILQMMRLESPGYLISSPIMTDLSLVRYGGYADLSESEHPKARLELEQASHLRHGVHLIAAQGADGTLIVGDSHHYADAPDPFAASEVEGLIQDELKEVLGVCPPVRERWTGTYASGPDDMFREAPSPRVRHVVVTSGTGASTAFAIAEETMEDMFGPMKGSQVP